MDTANTDRSAALRRIPSLDVLARLESLRGFPRPLVLTLARRFLDEVRADVQAGRLDVAAVDALVAGPRTAQLLQERCVAASALGHRRVLNATGIVLHTGLGRAPLALAAREALQAAAGYAIVELDRETGERNQREEHTARLLAEVAGASAALIVNNCAAAITLVLAALARDREVIVSRGQLVEIGGGFRMPDVMAQAGCRMVEVGTTNRTHLGDFAAAVTPQTAMLLRVHPSNFRVLGFTSMPEVGEMRELADRHGLLLVEDLGSGLLVDGPVPALEDEPRVRRCLADGVHLLCFSGDKLLGGPQCGLILGTPELVAAVRAHPLYRAFRCDKLTLAALEATLRIYRDGDPLTEIPTLRLLATPAAHLRERATQLARALGDDRAEIVASESFAGSGANPARALASWAVALPGGEALARALRSGPGIPVFGRIERDRILLDLRTLEQESLDEVAEQVRIKR